MNVWNVATITVHMLQCFSQLFLPDLELLCLCHSYFTVVPMHSHDSEGLYAKQFPFSQQITHLQQNP